MRNLLFTFFITCLVALAIAAASNAGVMTGNFAPSNPNTSNPQSNNSDESITSLEDELSGVVTGNFSEPENDEEALAQGVVTGNFHAISSESPTISAIASGVVTGNFQIIGDAKTQITTDTWYLSSDHDFRWLVTKDLEDNVNFLIKTLDDEKQYVISVELE